MMIGFNTLELNEATMIEAVQYWLNAQLVSNPPNVVGVEMSGGITKTFSVRIESKQVRP